LVPWWLIIFARVRTKKEWQTLWCSICHSSFREWNIFTAKV
jgi:hypothetical protein